MYENITTKFNHKITMSKEGSCTQNQGDKPHFEGEQIIPNLHSNLRIYRSNFSVQKIFVKISHKI